VPGKEWTIDEQKVHRYLARANSVNFPVDVESRE
jgi:hypothetical protein